MSDRPAPSSAPLPIEMRDVAFGSMRDVSLVVAEQINWTVRPGDYWVIAGLQGSGKSDFLMMTGGVMALAQGTYLLFGERMPIFEDARLATRLRLGLVFDTGQLFNHLTVSENIALPIRYHHGLSKTEAAAQVQMLLEELDLAEWADSTPGAIGRNWQKRVGLARALALKPELLLLDSPLTGLDIRHTNWWLSILDQLSKGHRVLEGRPLTLIATAADLRPWKDRAKQFALLKDKRFRVLGTWGELAAGEDLLHEVYEPVSP